MADWFAVGEQGTTLSFPRRAEGARGRRRESRSLTGQRGGAYFGLREQHKGNGRMKALPPGLQSHLATGATTLAWCWRVTRNDGTAFGFTDHDRDLAFDGTTFEAATGFTASEIKDALGLSVDNLEVSSALKSDRLNEDDLAAGLYDDAAVEIWRANWADTVKAPATRRPIAASPTSCSSAWRSPTSATASRSCPSRCTAPSIRSRPASAPSR